MNFSKLCVSSQLLFKIPKQTKNVFQRYNVSTQMKLYSSIYEERIDNYGVALTYRKYGTTKMNNQEIEKAEVFLPYKKPSPIANKVALVTGGTDEIGLICVKELLSCGAKAIMIADGDESEGKNILWQLSEEFGESKTAFIKTDTTNIRFVRNAFNWTKLHFDNIDIVVNIAKQNNSWEEQIKKNIAGIVRGTLLGFEYMGTHKSGNGGTIMNMIASSRTDGSKECPVFVGTKHFIIGFDRSISTKYHKDTAVKVITLCAEEKNLDLSEAKCEDDSVGCDFGNLVVVAKSGSVWTT